EQGLEVSVLEADLPEILDLFHELGLAGGTEGTAVQEKVGLQLGSYKNGLHGKFLRDRTEQRLRGVWPGLLVGPANLHRHAIGRRQEGLSERGIVAGEMKRRELLEHCGVPEGLCACPQRLDVVPVVIEDLIGGGKRECPSRR